MFFGSLSRTGFFIFRSKLRLYIADLPLSCWTYRSGTHCFFVFFRYNHSQDISSTVGELHFVFFSVLRRPYEGTMS